jgi:hypothetical protein
MSKGLEMEDGKDVTGTDISPHEEETNLLKRVISGKLSVPPHMMGFGFLPAATTPKTPSTPSQEELSLQKLRENTQETTFEQQQQINREKKLREEQELIALGGLIRNSRCPKNPFSSHDDLGKLTGMISALSQLDIDTIWKAIWCLDSDSKTTFSTMLKFELPENALSKFALNHLRLPEAFSRALKNLRENIRSILAFQKKENQLDKPAPNLNSSEKKTKDNFLETPPYFNGAILDETKNGTARGDSIPDPPMEKDEQDVPGNSANNAKNSQSETGNEADSDTSTSTSQDAPLVHSSDIQSPDNEDMGANPILPEKEHSMDKSQRITITELLGFSSAAKLRQRGISETSTLLNLSSSKFEDLRLDPRTIRAVLEKMIKEEYYFSDGRDATLELLERYPMKKSVKDQPNIISPNPATPTSPTEPRKLKSISKLFQNSKLVQKLRTLDIRSTEQLTRLTSVQLTEKLLSSRKPYQHLSIQAITRKLLENGLCLADGPEATENLINFHSAVYEPLAPASAPEASAAKAKPEAQASIETTLQKIGAALDGLKKDASSLSRFSFSVSFVDQAGKEYRITIIEQNISSAG